MNDFFVLLGPVCFNQFVVFAIGSGGFGGKQHSEHLKPLAATPTRAPDAIEVEKTTTSQAALYRLSADLNPLHIDPSFAAMGGKVVISSHYNRDVFTISISAL